MLGIGEPVSHVGAGPTLGWPYGPCVELKLSMVGLLLRPGPSSTWTVLSPPPDGSRNRWGAIG